MSRPDDERRDPPAPKPAAEVHPMRICPNCSAQLDDRKCKLICPTPGCGYYLSCSDFY